jgi:Uncharacterized protein conserved in bacteria
MTKRIILAALLALAPLFAQADETTPEKRQDILRLMEAGLQSFGTSYDQLFVGAAADNFKAKLVRSIRVENPEKAKEAMASLNREILAFTREVVEKSGGPVDRMVAAYNERFSDEEIRQLLAFYDSPLGKRYLAETVTILSETGNFYDAWTKVYGDELKQRLEEVAKQEGFGVEFR